METPIFLLDENKLRENLALIKTVKEAAGVDIILAFKGFAMWKAFPIIREYIEGATASSLFEAQLCMEEMGAQAHLYAPAYHPNEIKQLALNSKYVTFNSLRQLQVHAPEFLAHNGGISFGLRVNPGFSDVETDLYNPCADGSRLGVLAEQLPPELPEHITGLHFHCLCESSAESLMQVLDSFERLYATHLKQVQWVNMGGGHLITQKGYNLNLLIERLKKFKQTYNVSIILEPGSAFAWETGDLHASVLDIVENKGVHTALLDVSFTAHMPDTLEMPYRPQIAGANRDAPQNSKYQYRMGGGSCLAGDFLEIYGFDSPLKIGDTITLKDMMHYTMVKTTMFNGVGHPQIGIKRRNGSVEVLRTFSYDDFKNRLS